MQVVFFINDPWDKTNPLITTIKFAEILPHCSGPKRQIAQATVALAPNGHFAQELPLPWLRQDRNGLVDGPVFVWILFRDTDLQTAAFFRCLVEIPSRS